MKDVPKDLKEINAVRLNTAHGEIEYHCVWKSRDGDRESWELREDLIDENYGKMITEFEKTNKTNSRSARGERRSPRFKRTRTRSPSARSSPAKKVTTSKKTEKKKFTFEKDDEEEILYWGNWSVCCTIAFSIVFIVKFFFPDGSVHVLEDLPIVLMAVALRTSPEASKLSTTSSFLCLVWLVLTTILKEYAPQQEIYVFTLFLSVTFFKISTKQSKKEVFIGDVLAFFIVFGLGEYGVNIGESLLMFTVTSTFFESVLATRNETIDIVTRFFALYIVCLTLGERVFGKTVLEFDVLSLDLKFDVFEWFYVAKWLFALSLTTKTLEL